MVLFYSLQYENTVAISNLIYQSLSLHLFSLIVYRDRVIIIYKGLPLEFENYNM